MIPHTPIPLLMYHKVQGNIAHSRSWVAPETFRRQMELFQNHGYQSISFSQFLAFRKDPIQAKFFVITFDDGYSSVYTDAFPIMKEFGFTGTLFLTTSFIREQHRQDNSWDTTGEDKWPVQHLLWHEVLQLMDEGWEVGSHGATHRPLTYLPNDVAKNEIEYSKAFLEHRLSTPIRFFSYPFGNHDDRIKAMVRNAGYELAVIAGGNPTEYLDGDLFALRRKTMVEDVGEHNFGGYIENA